MEQMISGQTVKLYELTVTNTDPFGNDIVTESKIEVKNILIEPASNDAIVTDLQLSGKKLAYILHIPKGDTHNWTDTKVEFYGKVWRTYGDCLQYDERLTPLSWNKKVKVETYE